MRLPNWLNRELRIHQANTIAKRKREEMEFWFQRCTDARVEIAALKRQVASTQARLAEAQQESERLRAELDKYERAIPS